MIPCIRKRLFLASSVLALVPGVQDFSLSHFMGGRKERPIFVLFTHVQLYENIMERSGAEAPYVCLRNERVREGTVYMCGRALCLECRVLWVQVPPEAAHFLRISDFLGCTVLLCLVVCLTLLASFFFPSHPSLKHVYRVSVQIGEESLVYTCTVYVAQLHTTPPPPPPPPPPHPHPHPPSLVHHR